MARQPKEYEEYFKTTKQGEGLLQVRKKDKTKHNSEIDENEDKFNENNTYSSLCARKLK